MNHPMTDWLVHKLYAFPEPLDKLLREMEKRGRFNEISDDEFLSWYVAFEVLERARRRLEELVDLPPTY